MERGASVVVIAHRPSALASIQQILVLSEGRTVALGPRDEILRKVLNRPTAGDARVAAAPAKPTLIQAN
jgi:ABC-type protease/lipase transport system fused ATPase/permease subunit